MARPMSSAYRATRRRVTRGRPAPRADRPRAGTSTVAVMRAAAGARTGCTGTTTTADASSISTATAAPRAHWLLLKVVSNMKIEGRSLDERGAAVREHEHQVEHLERDVAQQDDGAHRDRAAAAG